MLVWQDIFTNDEVVSDANKPEPVKDSEGKEIPGLFMVQSRNVAVGSDAVDIGCGDAFGSGDQEVDDSVETVNNISDASIGFAYTEITFASKTELKSYLKSYFRKLLNHPTLKEGDEDTVTVFKSDAQKIVKFLLAKYNDLQYYMFRSCDTEAGLSFSYYPDGATTPVFMYIKWGLKEVKF